MKFQLSEVEILELKNCSSKILWIQAKTRDDIKAARKCSALQKDHLVFPATSYILTEMTEDEAQSFLCRLDHDEKFFNELMIFLKSQKEELETQSTLKRQRPCTQQSLSSFISNQCLEVSIQQSVQDFEQKMTSATASWLPHQISQFKSWLQALKNYYLLMASSRKTFDADQFFLEGQKVFQHLKNEELKAQKESMESTLSHLEKNYLEELKRIPKESDRESFRAEQRAWRQSYSELDSFLQSLKLSSSQAYFIKMSFTEERILVVKKMNKPVENPAP